MSQPNRVVLVALRATAALTLTFLTLWGVPPAAASANCSEASFRLPQSFDMVGTPHAFVAADFNGDGRPDIAASGPNGVEVRLNDGAGWFGVPARFNTGDFPAGLDAADFNGDGRTDLVVANSDRSDISLLPGDGAGGFGTPVNFTVGARTLSVLAADFNGDGKRDVAVAYLGVGDAGFVSVLLGDGAGGLSPAAAVSVNGFPDSLTSADFNKDGKRDLALISSQKPIVLLGDGAGGFAPPLGVMSGLVRQLTSADLNGDGNPDLAVAFRDDGITLLFGDGAGGFSAPTLAATGPLSVPGHVTAADFNGDGKLDLAAALFGWSSAGVLLGDGAGGFSAPRTFGAGSYPARVAAADFNGDGASDLVVGTGQNIFGSLNGFMILLGSGAGDFHAAPTLPVNTTPLISSPRRGPGKLALADFNNDGKTDLAVSNSQNVGIVGGASTVSILLADGAGGFTAAPEIKFFQGTDTGPVAAADFNKDGKADLAISIPFDVFGHAHTVAIYFGDGAGNFSVHGYVSVFTPNDLEVADLNNDTKPDLLVKKDSNFAALLGDGAGGFTTFEGPAGGASFSDLTSGDFNNDGKTDVAVTDYHNGKVYVALGAGNGTFDFMRHITVGFGPLAVAFADFNGDAVPDMATTRATGQNTGAVTILLGTGTGLFGAPTSYEIGIEPESVAVGDFNGDGKSDLVTGDLFSVGISALTGNGDGTFRPRVIFELDSGPAHLVVHDFNADGKADIGASQTSAHTVALLLNNLTTPLPCLSVGDATFTEGDAGEADAEFTVTLSGASDKTVKVSYFFGGFPATINQDFGGTPGTLTFAPGTTSQKIRAAVIGDITDEDDESFRVKLRSPSNALISDGEALGNILDNDPEPSITVADASAAEGNFSGSAGVSFHVTLSAPSTKPITVQYSTSPGTATETATGDYFPASGTLSFGGGQTAQTLNVTFRGDNVREPDETFTLSLSNPTNATIGDGTAQGTILNDDPVPTLSVVNSSAGETPSGSAVTVRVRMSNPTAQTVTVAYATSDVTAAAGSDYVAASGTLTFNPGEVEKAFDVAVIDDTLDEVPETFNVSLSNPTNATVAAEPGVHTIFDNDGPAISVNDVSVVEGQSGRTFATFTFSLSAPSPEAVFVRVTTADGTATGSNFQGDYVPFGSGRFVVFPSGTTTATQTVLVNGDQIIEPDETFFVNLSQPTGGTIADAQGLGTITNDDVTSVRFSADAVTANEADGSVQVTVQRVGDLSGVFTALYFTFDGTASERSDYNTSPGTLRFEPNETTKTITVFITNDALVESAENFFVSLSGVKGGATDSPSSVTVTINSDDAAPGPNPIDDTTFFVRQHYRDFLGRDPDAAGLAFWTGEIDSCGTDQQCREVKRVNVSAAFFLSIEFQETGFYAVRANRVAFGRRSNNAASRTTYFQLIYDQRRIGEGVVVGQAGYEQVLEANKNAYAAEFIAEPSFAARFPQTTADAYVDALYASAGVTPTAAERQEAIDAYTSAGGGAAGRTAALRRAADSGSVRSAELNTAFVLLQYHGYLRRNPTDAPDSDDTGYQFWLGKLEEFKGNYIAAEMVKAFISSDEYRRRFGP
jgi:hypothetical protein